MSLSKYLLFVLIFFASTMANGASCASQKLTWPKLVITTAENESYDQALSKLTGLAEEVATGEPEFYRSIIEYRLGKEKESLDSIKLAKLKEYYLSNAVFGIAYKTGMYGLPIDLDKSENFFVRYKIASMKCDNITESLRSPDKISILLMKLYEI